jgi:hypothetical protein
MCPPQTGNELDFAERRMPVMAEGTGNPKRVHEVEERRSAVSRGFKFVKKQLGRHKKNVAQQKRGKKAKKKRGGGGGGKTLGRQGIEDKLVMKVSEEVYSVQIEREREGARARGGRIAYFVSVVYYQGYHVNAGFVNLSMPAPFTCWGRYDYTLVPRVGVKANHTRYRRLCIIICCLSTL